MTTTDSNNDAKHAPTLIARLLSELKLLTQGEACDHPAGVCYCETFRVMAEAELEIASMEEVIPTTAEESKAMKAARRAGLKMQGCDCQDYENGLVSNECPFHG